MEHKQRIMRVQKHIALVAHDNCKSTLIDWCQSNYSQLKQHKLFATGTTGHKIAEQLSHDVTTLLSGPMGGDQQLGAMIAEGQIDILIFFWDPLSQQPHDPDIKALLRIAAVWNIPVACNQATADFLISSSQLATQFEHSVPDYQAYLDSRKREDF